MDLGHLEYSQERKNTLARAVSLVPWVMGECGNIRSLHDLGTLKLATEIEIGFAPR